MTLITLASILRAAFYDKVVLEVSIKRKGLSMGSKAFALATAFSMIIICVVLVGYPFLEHNLSAQRCQQLMATVQASQQEELARNGWSCETNPNEITQALQKSPEEILSDQSGR